MSTPEPDTVRANLLLCDAAQVVGEKLYILGGGWSYIWTPPGNPVAVVLAIDLLVPWNMGNRRLTLSVDLLTEDGEIVEAPGDEDGAPEAVRLEGTVVAGRGPLAREGTDLHIPLALPFRPVFLEPGGYYCEVTVGTDPIARAPFQVGVLGQQPE